MSHSKKPPAKSQISGISGSNSSSSTSLAATPNPRSLTPASANISTPRSRRISSNGLRRMLSKLHPREPTFDMLTPPSRSPTSKSSPQISRLAKAFVDSLTASHLSDFLVWMLYHDFVEFSEDAKAWYDPITPVDMRGWIALGQYLAASSTVLDTSHGFDLVVMDSICDRLSLQRSTVHGFLQHLADPEKMAYSQIATLVHAADADGQSYIEVLEGIHIKLHEVSRMVVRLKPTEGSLYDDWHAIITKRLRGYLGLVIEPRIANIRSGAPLVTAATSDQTPQVVKDGIRLNYLFELMQQKRPVPTARYGIDQVQIRRVVGLATPPSSPPEFHAYTTPEPIDVNARLYKENQHLRAQVSALQQDMKHLQITNDTLTHKLVSLGHDPSSTPASTRSSAQGDSEVDNDAYLHVPSRQHDTTPVHHSPLPARPRSLSYNAALSLNQAQDPKSHKRHRSEVLSWKYEDVFTALDPPSPSVRLSDPATGKLVLPLPPPLDVASSDEHIDEEVVAPQFLVRSSSIRTPSRAATLAAGPGRRSGMVFSKGQMDTLKAVREGTPRTSRDEEEFWAKGDVYGERNSKAYAR